MNREPLSFAQLARNIQTSDSFVDVLVEQPSEFDTFSVDDAGPMATAPLIDRCTIPLHEVCRPTMEDLDRVIGAALINGDGVSKPVGLLTHPVVDEKEWAWGSFGCLDIKVDATNGALSDRIIDLVYAIPAEFRHNASFLMSKDAAKKMRKLKDVDGRFLWEDGRSWSEPPRLMGYQVVIDENMPDLEGGARPIAFGDFQRAYAVALGQWCEDWNGCSQKVGGDAFGFDTVKFLRFVA